APAHETAPPASSRDQTRWPTEIPARSASYAFRSQLHHADGAGIKPGFTVAEVVQPHPAETVIKPELFNLLPGVNEPLTPVRQRAGVVRPHIEEVTHHKIGMAGHEFIHGGDAGQKAAGEDVALNKIDAFAVVAIALILNGDGLNRHPPAWTQTRLAGAEKCWQVALTDGLNHLNRHQLVVDPGQIAVVAEQHLNTILQPCPGDAR